MESISEVGKADLCLFGLKSQLSGKQSDDGLVCVGSFLPSTIQVSSLHREVNA